MHGLIEPQAFHVRVVEAGASRLRHLAEVVIAFEGDELGFRGRLDEFCENVERVANPGHDDGPRFDAAMAVDALLKRR